jgi:hypothetical protein
MTACTRRIAAAGYSHADSAVSNNGPSISHPAFPNQTNTPARRD